MTTVISRQDVMDVIDMADVIETVERAHGALSAGLATMPPRANVRLPGTSSAILPMTAALPDQRAVGVKLLAIFPDNIAFGRPALNAVVVLVDPTTGMCDAIVEAGALTAFRTAAASAVATKYLAREESSVLGLLGAGVEARSHLNALSLVRPIERVVVWNRTSARARSFAAEMQREGLKIDVAASAEEVVRQADIVCTVTAASDPILSGDWLRAGTHVNAVGAHAHNHREVDTKTVVRSRVIVDHRESAYDECGDLNIPVAEGAITRDHFKDELGEVVNNTVIGRSDETQVTLFKSLGLAIQDMSVARLVVERVRERGLGSEIEIY